MVVFSWYSGFSTNKTDRHDITEILLKVALSNLNQQTRSIFPEIDMRARNENSRRYCRKGRYAGLDVGSQTHKTSSRPLLVIERNDKLQNLLLSTVSRNSRGWNFARPMHLFQVRLVKDEWSVA
jgi:hypothetical protein